MRKLHLVLAVTLALTLALSSGVWAAAPSLPGPVISNTLEATAEPAGASITVDGLAAGSAVGLYDEFTVATTQGGYTDAPNIRVKITLTDGESSGFDLKYYEVNGGTWEDLAFDGSGVAWYGPTAGTPLSDITSDMRVAWNTADDYAFTLEVFEVDGAGSPIGTSIAGTEGAVTVTSAKPLVMSWDVENQTIEYEVGTGLTIDVTTELATGVTAVDNVLYILTVTDQAGNSLPSSVLSVQSPTYPCGYDSGGFWYYGPREGFVFDSASPVTTAMTGVFNESGTYNINVFAVQLPAE